MKTIKAIKNQLKRAFTIVELVIVIAVIAILAAVLIPTFANLINNAEESNDMVTVSNLNKIVAAYDTTGNIDTVNDALDGVLENGYSVSALTPTSDGNVIVYDSNSNRFALITENALKTSTPEEDDIIYTDSATTKTDWSTSTTWVFVKLSDVTATSNVYDLRSQSNSAITGYNSYILTGSDDWDSKNVIAAYGVSLYDYTNTVTLGSVEIVNSDSNAQTASATNSSAKTAVAKTTTAADTTVTSITVNVKAAYLSCTSSLYTISNYSTTTITAVSGCTLNEYGTASIYDATEINGGKIINCNSSISKDIVVHVAEGADVTTVLSDTTNTITVSTVTTTTETINVDTTGATVTITVGSVTIISAESTTVDLSGTIASPYEIDSVDDLTYKMISKVYNYAFTNSGYYKLTADISSTNKIYIETGIDVNLNLNGKTLNSGIIVVEGSLTVSGTNGTISCKYISNKGTTVINSGTITGSSTSGINSEGTLTINGGTVTGTTYGIYNSGIATINGGTIQSTGESGKGISNQSTGTLTITGGTITGKMHGIYNYGTATISGTTVIKAEGTSTKYTAYGIEVKDTGSLAISGEVEISATHTSSSQTTAGIAYFANKTIDNPVTINISGGTIIGGSYGITGQGSYSYSNVTISGGTIKGGDVGYYHPEIGTLTITGGSITGVNAGLQVCAGTISISGGTFTATATAAAIEASSDSIANKTGDGSISDGAALSIINRSGYGTYSTTGSSITSVKVTGGTFTSTSGEAIQIYSFDTTNRATEWSYTNYVSISDTITKS